MSTHSGIALRQGETFQTIYCHWDGHPKTMFPILQENYNSFDLALQLISFGDASSIGKKLSPSPYKPHTFMVPQQDVCVFYNRDRGDDWLSCRPVCYTWRDLFTQSSFEYVYIFEDDHWNVYNTNGKKLDLKIFGLGGTEK